MTLTARELWIESPRSARVRNVAAPEPGPGQVLLETELSGISPGTESVVYRGEVPDAVASLMAAPHQLGNLPFPVSHGYLNVAVVRQGPEDLIGKRVFSLTGHRSHAVVPVEACHVVPDDMPSSRALVAGIAEVGLNAVWEAQSTLGDRIAVVGAGLVGLVTALLLSQVTPARLQVVEVDSARRALVAELGLHAVSPEEASGDNDAVFHTSAAQSGLGRALDITGDDGAVVEMSWYGTSEPNVPLGGGFHARRLRIIGAQVGEVAAPKRLRRTRRQRLAAALELLDPRFDALVTGSSSLDDLPTVLDDFSRKADWTRNQLLHAVTYAPSETQGAD
ncbi:zinc-binding alcohol dehydrogenase [Nesterenkonia salmonea]|uniref:Zinc-binding alcohol dehydrogenase n=1 Tax=Nesterenkonia salmonea TaxID=1804987 RepID=A0A5R9BHU7_9MICC|nr:zinc-binding alcohol dehydrogenase [Nesterenkonia salmonea]TLQ00246.1 zinc-binding alcohol dehydrogenase [Nesterenkonia salmonea]